MTRKEAIERIKARFDKWALDDEDMKAIQTLIPEFSESEDERIIKTLQEYVKNRNWPLNGPTQDEVLVWLEKQKEQKPAEFTHHETNESLIDAVTHQMEDDGDIDDFVRKGIDDVVLKYAELGAKWQKEQKDYNKLYENIGKSEWFKKAYEGKSLGCDYEQKEQKPADLSEMLVHKEPYIAPVPTPMVADERKPAEWSPTKEQMVALSWAANGMLDNDSPSAGDIKASLRTLYNDLQSKSIKPAEWSEDTIRKAVKEVGLTQHQIDWFKNNVFPPKQEWSEEDSKRYISIGATLASSRVLSREDYDADMSWLRDLVNIVKYSRLSWKPSEEEMKALKECGECKRCIKKLYEDLQKRYGTC